MRSPGAPASWPPISTTTARSIWSCPGATAPRSLLGDGAGAIRAAAGSPIGADVRAAADLDGDGRLELIALAGGQPVVAERQGDTRLRLAGRCGRRRRPPPAISASTRSASADRSRCGPACTCSGGRSTAPIVHVGLGTATAAEVIRIEWPNGVLQSEFDRPAEDHDRRQPAAQGIVPVAVRVERPRDGVRDRPDLAVAARPAHQRAGHRRRADDRGLGQGPRRSARRRATAPTTCASPRSCGRRTSSIWCR